jgi:hypothetical protein
MEKTRMLLLEPTRTNLLNTKVIKGSIVMNYNYNYNFTSSGSQSVLMRSYSYVIFDPQGIENNVI